MPPPGFHPPKNHGAPCSGFGSQHAESQYPLRKPARNFLQPSRSNRGVEPAAALIVKSARNSPTRSQSAKRALDILLALFFTAVLGPILLILVVLILAVDGRPVFFGTERVKAPGQTFRMWKLRTMHTAPQRTGVCGGHKANRITPLGRWLRRLRLDEIPQLWNILKGDMSFVGPRPPEPQYVARFPELYAKVLQQRPGVTGLATLIYHAHEERLLADCRTEEEAESLYERNCIPRKARLDLIYLRHGGLLMDFWLIFRSGWKMLPLRIGQRL
jgi:lipopolysaccharide/colanic/teichoic acid biosynthesis glycosyltransferase